MAEIRVLLVDDERLIRQGLAVLLSLDPRFEIVGEAANGQEAVDLCASLQPQVVLMDIRMPMMDGKEATRLIHLRQPEVRVLILTTFSDREHIQEALANGAAGYLLKDSSPDLIAESISAVAKGTMVVHPEIASKLVPVETVSTEDFGLNEGQLEIVRLVASGHSNAEIAETLFLSEGTVKNKLSAILQSLNLRDRTQLAIFAWENRLVIKS